MNPLVSIFMISYNQEKYIIEALDSVLSQKVNFEYEVVLSDDCSTDNTQRLVDNYLVNHPLKNKVKFIKQKKNLGWMPNFIFTLNQCTGKYIAMCEGDDYWTSPLKLQKQIDFHENNPEYVLSCHQYFKKYNDGTMEKCPWFREDFFQGRSYFDFDLETFEYGLNIQTMTIVFRKNCLDTSLREKYKYYCDTHIKYHILEHGIARYFHDDFAVYRIHGNNVYMSQSERKKMKFSYDVYKDILKNRHSKGIKNLMNNAMRQRILLEQKTNRLPILSPYYIKLIFLQLFDTGSILLLFKNFLKGII